MKSFNDSESLPQFFKTLKAEIPQGKKVLKIEDPKEFFMDSYQDAAEWNWRPEQLKSDKTKQTFATVGITVTQELLNGLIDMGISYSVDFTSVRLKTAI